MWTQCPVRHRPPAAPPRPGSPQGHPSGCVPPRAAWARESSVCGGLWDRLQRGPRTKPLHTHTQPWVPKPRVPKASPQLGDCRGREPGHIRTQTCTAANSPRVGAEAGHTRRARGPGAEPGPSSSVQSPAGRPQEEAPQAARVVMATAPAGPGTDLGNSRAQ